MGFLATVPQAVHVALQNISKIGDALFTETALRIAHEVKMEGNAFDPFVYELFIRNKNVEMKVYLELCNALRFIIREAHREELEGKEFAKIVSRNTDISDEHALILMKGYNLTNWVEDEEEPAKSEVEELVSSNFFLGVCNSCNECKNLNRPVVRMQLNSKTKSNTDIKTTYEMSLPQMRDLIESLEEARKHLKRA
eukprot:TRINITY_DN5228_c0_g1_i1.p1 TRINITY_DN5228_c0_g1~~TRINITY_DN5228_c0_g1_i1.p1  ORF type:complete len:224 (-),score=34.92 TRINITY_DN5228_c0_g1_i1:49-636(-)